MTKRTKIKKFNCCPKLNRPVVIPTRKEILEILDDLKLLSDNDIESYRVRYHKGAKDHECSLDGLRGMIPGTPQEYIQRVSKDKEAMDKLKAQAGVEVTTKAPKNDYTESLRISAGIL